MHTLRLFALRYPEAQEAIACKGTSLEKISIKARNKAFLFLAAADAMVKLRESLPEAVALASKAPTCYKVGAHGWVTVTLSDDRSCTLDLLERWIDESYRLLAPKQLSATLPKREAGARDETAPASGKRAKKRRVE